MMIKHQAELVDVKNSPCSTDSNELDEVLAQDEALTTIKENLTIQPLRPVLDRASQTAMAAIEEDDNVKNSYSPY